MDFEVKPLDQYPKEQLEWLECAVGEKIESEHVKRSRYNNQTGLPWLYRIQEALKRKNDDTGN